MCRLITLFLLLMAGISAAQDKNLQDIYTEITTKINAALLTRQSAWEVSGYSSFNYTKTGYKAGETVRQYTLHIEPMLAYFIVDDLALGMNLLYAYDKTERDSDNDAAVLQQTFLGPIVKYYFGDDNVRPFLLTDYLFCMRDQFDGGELGAGAGILYHISGNLGLNLHAKYSFIWADDKRIESQSRIMAGIGLSSFIF